MRSAVSATSSISASQPMPNSTSGGTGARRASAGDG
jgi:hypothetical protein